MEGNNITGQLFRSVKSKAEAEGYEIEAFNADGNANLQVDQFNDALGKSPLAIILLAAMIRLAYFNVMEESDQNRDENGEKTFTGLPVTSAALIFPAVMILHILMM